MADGVSLTILGLKELHTAIDGAITGASLRAMATVTEMARLLQAQARDNAPKVSGTLARSIIIEGPVPSGFGSYRALVGPTAAYGRRIEFGFRQADSTGRVYNERAQPYFTPAYAYASTVFPAIFRKNMIGGFVKG